MINSKRGARNHHHNNNKVYKRRKEEEEKRKTSSFFCLGVFTGVLLLALLITSYLLLSFYLDHQQHRCSPEVVFRPQNVTSSKVCTSTACIEAGQAILEAADFCLDPCEDFYAFACNGWIRANPIDEDSGALGVSAFTLLSAKVDRQLRELLKSKNSTTTTTTKTATTSKAKSVAIARQLYHECFDLEAREKADFEPLRSALKSIFGTEWPLLEDKSGPEGDDNAEEEEKDKEPGRISSHHSQRRLLEALMEFTLLESTPLVDFFIDADANDTSRPVFYFTVPDGFDKDRIIYSDKVSYAAGLSIYRQSVYNMTVEFLRRGGRLNSTTEELEAVDLEAEDEEGDDDEGDEGEGDEPRTKKPKNPTLKLLAERLAEALLLEEELVMATSPAEELSDPRDGYNRLSLREFNLLTNGSFNWTLFPELFVQKFRLQQLYNITEDTEVVITDLAYFKKLPQILAETSPRTLSNYLGLKFLYYFRNRTTTPEELEDWCLALVTENFDLAVSRLYVEEHVPKDAKSLAEAMIGKIRTAFRGLLQTEASAWLDKETQAKALEKEKATRYETAYADFILDDRKLDEHYGLYGGGNGSSSSPSDLEVKPGHFYESVLALRRHRMITFARQMNYMIRE